MKAVFKLRTKSGKYLILEEAAVYKTDALGLSVCSNADRKSFFYEIDPESVVPDSIFGTEVTVVKFIADEEGRLYATELKK